MTNQITCPNCKTKIDVEKVLAEQISVNFEANFLERERKLKAEYEKKNRDLASARESVDEQVKSQVKQKEQQLKEEIRKTLLSESEAELKQLREENKAKSDAVKEFKNRELALRKERQELQEQKDSLALDVQRKIDEERKEIENKARKAEQDALQMTMKEKDQLLEKMAGQLNELQRKIEQGSVQSQGEAQEIELEKLLSASFPVDEICEVPKGVEGGDCLQRVRNNIGKECGLILYESKRTKTFGKDWIEKLKADMRNAKADVAILVTEARPKDMPEFGNKDGILICTFNEVRPLAALVRESIVKLSEARTSQENRGEKMQVLYNYLTSNDFFLHFSAVVGAFTKMKSDLDAEKRAMKGIWSRREKELDIVLDSTVSIYGSIKGIAGSAIGDIVELELGVEEQLTLKN